MIWYKWTLVALQFGLLMPFWVKTISKGHGLLFSVGCSCPFGSKHYQKDMGCSSAWVAQAVLGQTITNSIGCGLLFSMGCSCQNTLLYQYTEPTLIAGLLRLLMGCSVALQRDPKSRPNNSISRIFFDQIQFQKWPKIYF